MTPRQCRDARELLKWSQDDLAQASYVPVEVVAKFEASELVGMLASRDRMRNALEAAGIRFPFTIKDGQFVPLNVTLLRFDPEDGK